MNQSHPTPANRRISELNSWPHSDTASGVRNVEADVQRNNETGEAEIMRQLEYSSAEDANGRTEVGTDLQREIDSKHSFPWLFIGGVLLAGALVAVWMIWE